MKKIFKHIWVLAIFFLGLPIVASLVLVMKFSTFLENDFVQSLIAVSGYFFTFSSLLLVFALFNTFNPSDHQRAVADKKFVEGSLDNLISSLRAIENGVKNCETEHLYESCEVVTDIFGSLENSGSDVVLKAYTTEIKQVVNLIRQHGLSTIGFNSDLSRLKAMKPTDTHNIISKVGRLVRHLEKRSNLNED